MKAKDWLAFIALGTIWGSSFLWIKIAVQEIGPIGLVAFRLLFGIFGLLVVAYYTHSEWPRQPRLWLILTFIGLINNAVPYVLISWGEQYIPSSMAAILNSTTPLFVMVLVHIFLHDDRLSLPRLVYISIGFAGVVVLVSRDLGGGVGFNLLGQLAVLLASFSYAGASVYARRTTRGVSSVTLALVPLLGADLIVWLAATSVEAPIHLPILPITWIAMLWLGLLGTCVAYLLYYYLLHSVGPTRTTLVTYVFPLVGVALGVAFLHETLDWHLLVGGTLVVGSILVVNLRS